METALRPVTPRDRPFLRRLAGEVFSQFGHYDQMVPDWLDAPGVWGFVATTDEQPVGFALVSLGRLPRTYQGQERGARRRREGPLALDLMSIAVIPDRQRRGVGRRILAAVLQEADRLARSTFLPLEAVTLTVARENQPARHLFIDAGFDILEWDGETYPRGQAAIRMARQVPRQ